MNKNTRIIGRIKPGQPIKADPIQTMAQAINDSAAGITAPGHNQRRELREYQRTSTTVTVTDSGGDTIDIEQIDTITFRDSQGASWVFFFNNPPVTP